MRRGPAYFLLTRKLLGARREERRSRRQAGSSSFVERNANSDKIEFSYLNPNLMVPKNPAGYFDPRPCKYRGSNSNPDEANGGNNAKLPSITPRAGYQSLRHL
jgi:hypothetical protein